MFTRARLAGSSPGMGMFSLLSLLQALAKHGHHSIIHMPPGSQTFVCKNLPCWPCHEYSTKRSSPGVYSKGELANFLKLRDETRLGQLYHEDRLHTISCQTIQ